MAPFGSFRARQAALAASMVVVASCSTPDHAEPAFALQVNHVIQQHEAIFQGSAQPLPSYAENLARAQQQVAQVRDIDTLECPADFRVAFLDHCHALEDFVRLLPQDESWAFVVLAFAGLTWLAGDAEGAVDGTFGEYRRATDRIWETWKAVELVAVKHGARLGQGAARGSAPAVARSQ